MMSESDALLPDKETNDNAPYISLRHIWDRASKLWFLVGTVSALVAGGASAYTCVLYGRILDAMARATFVGVSETLTQYLQLATVEFFATWTQYFCWSHVVAERDDAVEALGAVWSQVGLGITATAISLYFGWDALLVIVVVGVSLVSSSFIVFKRLTKSNRENTNKETNKGQLEQEIDYLWQQARSLRLADAVDTAIERIQRLLDESDPKKSRVGMMVVGLQLLLFPTIVTVVYTAWKIGSSSPRDARSAVDVAVVFLAGYAAVSSFQRAQTTYQKGDVSVKSMDKLFPSVESTDEAHKAAAEDWIRSRARPYARRTVVVVLVAIIFACLYTVTALALGYTATWLLEMPFTPAAVPSGVWTLVLGLVACGGAIGLLWDLDIRAQSKPIRMVFKSIVVDVFAARLRADEEPSRDITAKTLLSETILIGMCLRSIMEPQHLQQIAIGVVSLVTALMIDPLFALAVLALSPFSNVEYFVLQRRDQSLYRRFGLPVSAEWPVALGETFVRAALHLIPTIATILLSYLQAKRVADGSSSVFSVLGVLELYYICFAFAHSIQFASGSILRGKALTAAATLHECIQAQASKEQTAHDHRLSAKDLEGDLVLQQSDGESVRVSPGERVELASPVAVHIVHELFVTRSKGFAVVGDVDLSDLPSGVLADHVMVINDEPLRLPGTLRENVAISHHRSSPEEVEQAATDAGLKTDDLEQTVTVEEWKQSDAVGVKAKLLVARVLLQRPNILIVEGASANNTAAETRLDMVKCVDIVQAKLPQCRTVVLQPQA